ncbi:hypothetical protein TKK_0012155 [Trichogramma kaykai]
MAAVNLDTFKKGEKWRAYVDQLNSFIQLKDIPADKQKDFLITQLSTPVYEILCGLCKPDSPQHPKFGFDDLIKKLDDFLTPPDKYVAHFEYNREKQGIQETIKEYKFTEQLSEGIKTEAMCFKVYRSADSIKDFVNFTAEVDWDHNESTKHITTSDSQSNAEVFTVSEFRCLQQQQHQQHHRTDKSMRATMLDDGKLVGDTCCCCRDSSSTESQKQEEQAQPPSASSNGSNVEANGPAMLEPAHLTRSNNGYPNSASSSSVQTGLRMSSSCAAIKSSGSYMPLHQPNRSLPLRPAPPLPRRRSSSIVPPQQSVLDKNARNNKDAPSNRGSPFSTESLLRCDEESSTRRNWSRIDQQPPNASEQQQQQQQATKMVPPLKLKKLSREDDHSHRGPSIEREETSTPSSSVGEYCIITPERSDQQQQQQQQHSAQTVVLASDKTTSNDCASSDHEDCAAKSIEITIPSMPELGINEQRTDRISVPQESAKPFIVKYTIANDGQFSRLMPINFQPVSVVQTSPITNKLADPDAKSDKLEHDQNSNLISSMPIISQDSRNASKTHSKPGEIAQANGDWHKRKHWLRDKLRDHLASVLEIRRKLPPDQESKIEECEERIERITDLLKKLNEFKTQESFDKFFQEDIIEEFLQKDEEKCDERRDDTSITESSNSTTDEVFSELQHLGVKVSSTDAETNRNVTTNSGIRSSEVIMDNNRTTMNLEKASANGYVVNSSSPRSVIVDARPTSNSVASPTSMPTKPKGYSSFMIEELTATAHQPTAVRSQQQHQVCLPLNSPREALIASTAWLGNEHQQHQPQLNSMTDVVAQSYTYNRVVQQSQMMQEESKKLPCKRPTLDDVSVSTSLVDKKKRKKVNDPAAPPMSQWPTSGYMQTHAPYNKTMLNNLQLQRMHNSMNNPTLRYPVSSSDVGLWSPAIMVYPHNEIHSQQQQQPINEPLVHRVVDYKIMDQQQQAQTKTARPLQEYQQQMSSEFVMNVHRAHESEQQLRHEAAKRSLQSSKTQLLQHHHQNSISHESSTSSRVIPDPFVNLNHWAVIEMSKKNSDTRKNGSIVLPDNRQSYFQTAGGIYKGGPVDLVNNNFANTPAGHWAVVAAEQQQARAASYHQQQQQHQQQQHQQQQHQQQQQQQQQQQHQQQQQEQTSGLATTSGLYRRQPTHIPNYSSKLGVK